MNNAVLAGHAFSPDGEANGRDQLWSYSVYKQGAANSGVVKFAAYEYRNFLGYVSQKVEVDNQGGVWKKKTTDFRHLQGPMPGQSLPLTRREPRSGCRGAGELRSRQRVKGWLRGVMVQQWLKTTTGSAFDYGFQEAYGYDWPLTRRRPRSGHCEAGELHSQRRVKGWMGRRVGKSYCDNPDVVANDDMDCSECGQCGGITCDYDGANVLALDTPPAAKRPRSHGDGRTASAAASEGLVERKIDPATTANIEPPDQVYSIYAHGPSEPCADPGAPGLGLLQRTGSESPGRPRGNPFPRMGRRPCKPPLSHAL